MEPVRFFKALADDTRLQCLLLVAREGELCVCELQAALGLDQPKISRHLALLRDGGLLLARRRGQWVYYRLDPALPNWCRRVINQTLADNLCLLKDPLVNLENMGDRPNCGPVPA